VLAERQQRTVRNRTCTSSLIVTKSVSGSRCTVAPRRCKSRDPCGHPFLVANLHRLVSSKVREILCWRISKLIRKLARCTVVEDCGCVLRLFHRIGCGRVAGAIETVCISFCARKKKRDMRLSSFEQPARPLTFLRTADRYARIRSASSHFSRRTHKLEYSPA